MLDIMFRGLWMSRATWTAVRGGVGNSWSEAEAVARSIQSVGDLTLATSDTRQRSFTAALSGVWPLSQRMAGAGVVGGAARDTSRR